jgi:hypothetical protein
VTKLETGLEVKYVKTHSGHSLVPGKVGLTSPQKRNVAKLLGDGVPSASVLQKLRKQQVGNVNRAGISNTQDIRNIAVQFKLSSDVKFDPNDAKSLDITIRKLENEGDSGVLFVIQTPRNHFDRVSRRTQIRISFCLHEPIPGVHA